MMSAIDSGQAAKERSLSDMMQQHAGTSFARKHKSKGPAAPWWTKPDLFFYIPFALFSLIMLWACMHSYADLSEQQTLQHDGLSSQDKAAISCNPTHRPVTTCAHRGNAAELLSKAGAPTKAPILQQMELLWQAGVLCFDMDVIHLKGGDMLVGHPADIAAQVNAAALPGYVADSSSISSDAGSKQGSQLPLNQLHKYTLQELHAAGLSDATAPTLHSFLEQFQELVASGPPGSSRTRDNTASSSSSLGSFVPVQKAANQRSWVRTPVVHLEPKGPAAVDAQAFLAVAHAAAAAGVSQYSVLWLRQMPPGTAAASSSSNATGIVVSQLANSIKQGLQDVGSGAGKVAAAGTAQEAASKQRMQGPLLGLIVADLLLQKPELSAVQAAGDASKLSATLLATAGGVYVAGSSNTATAEEGAAVVMDAFDLLAPSMKLPPRVLQSYVASKPCLLWTLETAGNVRRAMWLGIDMICSNAPIAHDKVVQQEASSLCKG